MSVKGHKATFKYGSVNLTMKELLTGKAKELFEEWFIKQDFYNEVIESYDDGYLCRGDTVLSLEVFKELPLSIQWGVIEDFAESLDYKIDSMYSNGEKSFYISIYINGFHYGDYDTRNEARGELIKQLNILINTELTIKE